MPLLDFLLGHPIASSEERGQQIGVAAGVPIFGLDALSSAAYGPEAALTLLIPLGVAGVTYILPLSGSIIALLIIVFFSYRQTIAAYPGGGGSYTVAQENLGTFPGLLAAAALMIDYVLTAAVGISAGIGALISAAPSLQPHILALCLTALALLTIVNLRGIREAGGVFMLPTYLFLACMFIAIAIGVAKSLASGGHPNPVMPLPKAASAGAAVSIWLLLKAFSSGCTALTGVEAVSNGVKAFREPSVAQRTLAIIIVSLVVMLGRDCLSGECLQNRRYRSKRKQLPEHSFDAFDVGRRPWSVLLRQYQLDPNGIDFFSKHGLRGFSARVSNHCAGSIPSSFIREPWTAPGLFTGDLRSGGSHSDSADCIRRRYRPINTSVRDRRLPRFHSLAGRHGSALEAGKRPAVQHIRQWPGRLRHRADCADRPGSKILGRSLGHGGDDSGHSCLYVRGAEPLQLRPAGDRD